EELVGVRTQAHLVDLPGSLVAQMGVDHVRREYVALEQESVIALERIQCLLERAWRRRDFGKLFGREIVKVLVDRLAGIEAVLNPVETSHQHRGERQVGTARWVGATELDALCLGTGRVHRYAARRRAIALGIAEVD